MLCSRQSRAPRFKQGMGVVFELSRAPRFKQGMDVVFERRGLSRDGCCVRAPRFKQGMDVVFELSRAPRFKQGWVLPLLLWWVSRTY